MSKHKRLSHKYFNNSRAKEINFQKAKDYTHRNFYRSSCTSSYSEFSTPEHQAKGHAQWMDWNEDHRKNIAQVFESGANPGFFHAPKWYRDMFTKSEKHYEKIKLSKIRKDIELWDDYSSKDSPCDADWYWF